MTNALDSTPPPLLPGLRPLTPEERYLGLKFDSVSKSWVHVLLLGVKTSQRMTWDAANTWAESLGGRLPTRQELSLIHTNLAEIESGRYWTGEAVTYTEFPYVWTSYLDNEEGTKTDLERPVAAFLTIAVCTLPVSP